ncbi:MAG TPA: hypothetical protein DCS07_15110 [Bdellovibrionales bacterium]|nr:MAG: hypothetical protein A2Z97_16360 [Bdellovibrionales bacterium GWB1_52_6]OFZ03843.1 MAG: hypothetical protein A2X97_15705 [Bdellovibrionales bacterium GWA1_52_35]OFZ38670.1 MAG: hypothetical protein A2070_10785 [Bdellovibrionales bacterium GWC1_52_8]HAR43940.1 hypothetical protein [Bdellovibrionales bacterium]HCM39722.1 hypothetical protein [Bdellovibrionales bacterium]
MSGDAGSFFSLAKSLSFLLLTLSLFFVFIRLARGPTLPDRVVALDLTAIIVVGFVCIYSITVEQPIYLDMAIALALIAFLGTVAFARYALHLAQRRGPHR